MNPPTLCLLRLDWRVLKPITHIPHFQGALWSALFRHAYNGVLKPGEAFHQTDIVLHPADFGVPEYKKGDCISLGVAVPQQELARLATVLAQMEHVSATHGQFQPGKTLHWEAAQCRISGAAWPQSPASPLDEGVLADAAHHLTELPGFQMVFHAPLRLTKPPGSKFGGRYCDQDFFRTHPTAIDHLLSQVNGYASDALLQLTTEEVHGQWMDINYGRTTKPTTLGGFVGILPVRGKLTEPDARALLSQSFLGIGKNRAFGLGCYAIPEVTAMLKVQPLPKHRSLWKAFCSLEALQNALDEMPEGSPGPDGLTVGELRHMSQPVLHRLMQQLEQGTYQPGGETTYSIPKPGGTRTLQVGNVMDRLLQRMAARLLTKVVDPLLSTAGFAYREGFGRQRAMAALKLAYDQGFRYGLKADIQAFFPSVNRKRLWSLLSSLLPSEPLLKILALWLPEEGQGLPQGNPISPLLSNLFLDDFDRRLLRQQFKLVRYADDFVVLFKSGDQLPTMAEKVGHTLGVLGLALALDKTKLLLPSTTFRFLGYTVREGEIEEDVALTGEGKWYPLYQDQLFGGQVLYVTSLLSKSCNQGNNLVLEGDQRQVFPWRSLRAIVVVGQQRLSSSVMFRALREGVPIYFQGLLGRPWGAVLPNPAPQRTAVMHLQRVAFASPPKCLAWAKKLILAKILNRRVLLIRNGCDPGPSRRAITNRVERAENVEALRGVEGAYAAQFFKAYQGLVHPFQFKSRTYRPPDGPVNAMLSLAYTLLYHRMNAALLRAGLDTYSGFFHQGRGNHAALASDLMEEVRFLAERTVLSVIHLGIIGPQDFEPAVQGGPAVRLAGDTFRSFIKRFEQTMATTFAEEKGKQPISYNAYLDQIAEKVGAALKLDLPYQPRILR